MGLYTQGMIIPYPSDDAEVGIITFEYNPYEIHLDKEVQWAKVHVAGRDQPYMHFGCGEVQKLTLAIEVNKSNNSDFFVKGFMDDLNKLTKPTVQGAGMTRPPRVQLILGAHFGDSGDVFVVKRVHVRYGAHRGQQHHFTYLADNLSLLPKEGHVLVHLGRWM